MIHAIDSVLIPQSMAERLAAVSQKTAALNNNRWHS
jgi:hypothetical protein